MPLELGGEGDLDKEGLSPVARGRLMKGITITKRFTIWGKEDSDGDSGNLQNMKTPFLVAAVSVTIPGMDTMRIGEGIMTLVAWTLTRVTTCRSPSMESTSSHRKIITQRFYSRYSGSILTT